MSNPFATAQALAMARRIVAITGESIAVRAKVGATPATITACQVSSGNRADFAVLGQMQNQSVSLRCMTADLPAGLVADQGEVTWRGATYLLRDWSDDAVAHTTTLHLASRGAAT